MHGVAHARRIGRVVAALEAEIVVAEVADHVGDDEADENAEEIAEVKASGIGGQKPRDEGRLRGDDKNDAARGIKEPGDRIEARDVLDAGFVKAGKRAEPKSRPRRGQRGAQRPPRCPAKSCRATMTAAGPSTATASAPT